MAMATADMQNVLDRLNRLEERMSGLPVRLPGTPGAPIKVLKVVSVEDDHLVCRSWDFTDDSTGSKDINVAKPWLLRRTPFDGTTQNGISYDYLSGYQRTADDGTEESQVIVPAYDLVDDNLIFAMVAPTGVAVDGETVRLLDINVDGRAWAKEYAGA